MTKYMIVTGSSSGIGKAIYEHYKSKKNWNVLGISDTTSDTTDYVVDVGKVKDFLYLDRQIDCLINCAGIFTMPEINAWEVVKRVMNVNFWGTYWMIQSVIPHMPKGGNIINIASVSGITCEQDEVVYAASKAGVISITKSFALRLSNLGIRVNCISPGFFDTNLVKGTLPSHLLDSIPLGFEAKTKDILPTIKMILASRYLTGSNIVLDGGHSL